MASVADKLVTAEEFHEMPEPADGSRQELVRGRIVSMPPPGFRHGLCQVRIAGILDQFARSTHQGRVTVESGVVTERGPDSVRGPDVAYWSVERLPLHQEPVGYPEVAPDLCVEVLSPADRIRDVRGKMGEYFARGVRLVWIVDPDDRTVAIYRSLDEGRIFHENATLTGEDVLPGFTCQVADLFA